jgi:hypothetical protein
VLVAEYLQVDGGWSALVLQLLAKEEPAARDTLVAPG